MRLYKLIAALALAAATLAGCYDDKGNYDYRDLTLLTVEIPEGKYTGVSGETIRIEPKLTFSDGSTDESTLLFDWSLNGETISTERNLAFAVDRILLNAQCQLRVTDTRTGVTALAMTSFDLTEKHNVYGWMVLADLEGESLLTYFSQKGATLQEYIPYVDVFRTENGRALGTEPVRLLEHFFYGSRTSSFWVVQQGSECVDLKGDDLKVDITLSNAFLNPAFGQQLKVKQIAELRWLTVVVDQDGRAYTRKKEGDGSYHSGKFLDYPLTYQDRELRIDYFFDWRTIKTGCAVMLEGEPGHKRLLAVSGYDKATAGKVMPLTVSSGGYPANFSVHADDLGDYEVVYADYFLLKSPTSSNAHGFGLILKSPEGQYLYQEYQINDSKGMSVSITPKRQVAIDIASKIDPAGQNLFYFTPYTNYANFYMSSGRTLYYIDRVSIDSKALIEVKTFDAEITALDGESSSYGQTLGVGLANGEFYVLDQKNGNQVVYQAPTGGGRIVDIRYKIKTSQGWPR